MLSGFIPPSLGCEHPYRDPANICEFTTSPKTRTHYREVWEVQEVQNGEVGEVQIREVQEVQIREVWGVWEVQEVWFMTPSTNL